ncbi:hypothetical protein ACET3Z_001019 [Daucus carota]
MDMRKKLIAGSHSRKELVYINVDDTVSMEKELNEDVCEICGDMIEMTEEMEIFVACEDCGFPVCRACYEYERREGNQVCPRCKTRYRRIKGCPWAVGDDEEEEALDDLEDHASFIFPQDNYGAYEGEHTPPKYSRRDLYQKPHIPRLGYQQEDEEKMSTQVILSPFMVQDHDPRLPCATSSVALQPRPLAPKTHIRIYGYGSVAWKNRMEDGKKKQSQIKQLGYDNGEDIIDNVQNYPSISLVDEGRQQLSRKLPIASSKINPYRIMVVLRIVVLALFFHYRFLHPVLDAYALWLTAVMCEVWFSVSWILDQFPKWYPVERETYLERLSLRYENDKKSSQLPSIDVFVSTFDPLKEPPLVTANTILSILAVDYPPDKVACYLSDDGAAMLTFEALSETSQFATKWVPFCKKYNIEPRAPEWYFSQKNDYLKNRIHPDFSRERRAMKREYEEFKVRINGLVSTAEKAPEEGWTMQDGTPWPGNNIHDHPAMIQVMIGESGVDDIEGNKLPKLVYVSREKRPGYDHHQKAGAMNSLVRVSAILSNAQYILDVDCDHYINNSKALKEAMCFMLEPTAGKKICYVQFPQRYNGIDCQDRYSNRNVVFFEVIMKGLDGLQGPIYVGTGCVFRRQALYGCDAPVEKKIPTKTCNCFPQWCFLCFRSRKNKRPMHTEAKKQIHSLETIEEREEEENEGLLTEELTSTSQEELEKKFGQSSTFVQSTQLEDGGILHNFSSPLSLREALYVVSGGYEDKTDWGKEVGWIYGSTTEDILTGFRMHCHGWRSVYCMPKRPAFKGSAPINLSDRLNQVLQQAMGSVEIFLSRQCPIWYGYGGRLKCLQRLSYINSVVYPWTSIPLTVYCTLPVICLLTGKFIIPEISSYANIVFLALFISIATTSVLEMRWGGVGLDDWWRNEQFWVIGGVSSHLFALFQCLLRVLAGVNANLTLTSRGGANGEHYVFKWTSLLIPPTTLLVLNTIGVVIGISDAINNGYAAWGPLFAKLFFAFWVIAHLYPFLKGLLGKQDRMPTIVMVWSILLASIVTLMWARVNPFAAKDGPVLEVCGLDCD